MERKRSFWREMVKLSGSVTPFVQNRVLVFGLWGAAVWAIDRYWDADTGLGVAPYEIIGAVLALLLVMRTNSGYDRWWEGRKLWGGIVNQSRNLSVVALAYGPNDADWRRTFVRLAAVFPHLVRHSLRGERDLTDERNLLDTDQLQRLQTAEHLPLQASLEIAKLLQIARDRLGMDGFAFVRADEQRSLLIDYTGACERILKTPLAEVLSIKIRRFLLIYLVMLPVAIVDRSGMWTPFLTMLVAYPLLALDQIGIELENPFSPKQLSHLPLEEISCNIERNLLSLEASALPAANEVERLLTLETAS